MRLRLTCVALGVSVIALAHHAPVAIAHQSQAGNTQDTKQPAKSKAGAKAIPKEDSKKKEQQKTAKTDDKKQPQADAKPKAAPSLDELLGIDKKDAAKKDDKKGDHAADAKDQKQADANKGELDRALSGEQIAEAFVDAVKQMGDVASLLRESRDAGLPTQRMQEEIIRKLDMLIKQAEQQRQRRQKQRQQQGQKQQGQQSPSQPQQAATRQKSGKGDNRDERMPPPPQSAQFAGWLEQAKARWGALPARLRDALIQGSGDSYSALYEALTREYYRKLAEQRSQRP